MKFLISSILIVLYPICLQAQSVEEICKIHIEKLGGKDHIEKIENIRIEQTIYSNNMEVPQTTFIVPGKIYYQEVNFQTGNNTICVVDGKGWAQNSFVSAKANDLSEKEAQNYMINSNVFGPLYDYYIHGDNSLVKEIVWEGEQRIERDMCYKLKVIYKSDYIVHVYVSKKSFMIKKVESPLGSMSYSNYRKVDKVMFPFYVEIANSMGVMVGEVINLKTNTEMDYAKFDKP